jgi:hypothetical protein
MQEKAARIVAGIASGAQPMAGTQGRRAFGRLGSNL